MPYLEEPFETHTLNHCITQDSLRSKYQDRIRCARDLGGGNICEGKWVGSQQKGSASRLWRRAGRQEVSVESCTAPCSLRTVSLGQRPMGSPQAEVTCQRSFVSHNSRPACVSLSLSHWLAAACGKCGRFLTAAGLQPDVNITLRDLRGTFSWLPQIPSVLLKKKNTWYYLFVDSWHSERKRMNMMRCSHSSHWLQSEWIIINDFSEIRNI